MAAAAWRRASSATSSFPHPRDPCQLWRWHSRGTLPLRPNHSHREKSFSYFPSYRKIYIGVFMARNTIIIDADDTLWENNVFFDKAISHFISQLEYLGYTPDYIRHILNETERRNIRQHGYGVRSFRRSLEETYLKLAGNMARREMVKAIEQMAAELENTPPQILEGVPETLAYLAKRHRLILLTKGEAAEQAGKVERPDCSRISMRSKS